MAAYSSGSRRYDVFPSFNGEDVRKTFLSHLLKELDRRSIKTFIDHGIERSRPITPVLLSAIRESDISIVVFSKNYASSTWCLNELVEIHKCFTGLVQMVIPVFYNVDPCHVRKQTGEFGEVFQVTCEGKTEYQIQMWVKALADVANMAGEDLQNWSSEADMVEKIANDVSNKLISPSNDQMEVMFQKLDARVEEINSTVLNLAARVRGIEDHILKTAGMESDAGAEEDDNGAEEGENGAEDRDGAEEGDNVEEGDRGRKRKRKRPTGKGKRKKN